jgi:hypothetical protein
MPTRASPTHSDGLRPSLAELIALRDRVRGWPPAQRGAASVAGPAMSPFRGRGMEYAESRPYAAGDDARHIDWRLSARTGKPHTKLFQSERERITLLVADTSPALYFGTRVRFKSVQAARAGAIAAWAAQHRGDRIGALRGSPSEPPVVPNGGSRGALRVLDALVRWYAQPPANDAGLTQALASAARLLHPGASVVVLADAASGAGSLRSPCTTTCWSCCSPIRSNRNRRATCCRSRWGMRASSSTSMARSRGRAGGWLSPMSCRRNRAGCRAWARACAASPATTIPTSCSRPCSIRAAPRREAFTAMTGGIPGLRDIHLPAAPGWWPPAPGWWILAGLLAISIAWLFRRFARPPEPRRRPAYALREFDEAVGGAGGAPARLAAASAFLRRAARLRDPSAALLEGDAWLRFLDGDDPARSFSQGSGSLLRDGAFRRTLDADIDATLALARSRFAALLEPDAKERVDA